MLATSEWRPGTRCRASSPTIVAMTARLPEALWPEDRPWFKGLVLLTILLVVSTGLVALLTIVLPRAAPLAGTMGVLVSATAAAWAFGIYSRQFRESREHESQIKDRLDLLQDTLTVAKENEDTSGDQEQPDQYPDESTALEGHGRPVDEDHRAYGPDEIPLTVVKDLVTGWDVVGKGGRWPVSSLVGSVRKSTRGNHPWFVTLRDPDGNRLRTWKVSRGGRGKTEPTVLEVTAA